MWGKRLSPTSPPTSASSVSMTTRAADFRNAFDKAYALPRVSGENTAGEDFLAIRIAGDGYAIRLREVSGLVKGRRIVACPSFVPEFQGIAGVRGTLVSVYSLPALLGYHIDIERASWLLLCEREESVGFAFAEFTGFTRALPGQIYTESGRSAPSTQSARTAQVLRVGGEVRAIVSISRLLERCLGSAKHENSTQASETNRTF
jgi:chemotaxis signal transduction protein